MSFIKNKIQQNRFYLFFSQLIFSTVKKKKTQRTPNMFLPTFFSLKIAKVFTFIIKKSSESGTALLDWTKFVFTPNTSFRC